MIIATLGRSHSCICFRIFYTFLKFLVLSKWEKCSKESKAQVEGESRKGDSLCKAGLVNLKIRLREQWQASQGCPNWLTNIQSNNSEPNSKFM